MGYKDPQKQRESSLARYYAKREEILEYQKKRWSSKYAYDEKFREKRRLRDSSRFRKGGLQSLKDCKCSECSETKDLQRHHPSYESTDIVVLCRVCHNRVHSQMREKTTQMSSANS